MSIIVQLRVNESNYGALLQAIEDELEVCGKEHQPGLVVFENVRLELALKIVEHAYDSRCAFITLRNR